MPTFAGVSSSFVRELGTLDSGDMAPNQPVMGACKTIAEELKDTMTRWQAFLAKDLPAFNAVLAKSNTKPIPAPKAVMAHRG